MELNQRRAGGADYVLLTPGNYGCDFIRAGLNLRPEWAVQTSNFIGQSLDICRELGFRGALLVGHIGKLVKVGGGMLNTHSKYGDCRMEILGGSRRKGRAAPGKNRGNSGLCGLRRCPADFTGGRLPGENSG